MAWRIKRADRLIAVTIGHVPREISRAVWFFLERGGSLAGKVADEIYRPSPIAKGGLEILLSAEFKISDQKRKYLERMREIVELNYIQIDVDFLKLATKSSLEYVY